jgi:hypothetical protein
VVNVPENSHDTFGSRWSQGSDVLSERIPLNSLR